MRRSLGSLMLVAALLAACSSQAATQAPAPAGAAIMPTPAAAAPAQPATPAPAAPSAVSTVSVPNIVGMSAAEAGAALAGAGLTLGSETDEPDPVTPAGKVASQDPAAGSSLGVGFSVDFVVSTGAPPPTATPTLAPTPKPTPKPTPIAYAALSSRTWALLVKAPDNYTGKTYKVYGCISQFDAATGPGEFRAQASYQIEDYWYSNGQNAIFTGDEGALADYVQGDIVAMNVLATGSYSYDTQAGGNTTVPSFEVVTIKRLSGSC